jgi:hypothetical protein
LRSPEKTVLSRFLRHAERRADGAKPHSLKVAHFENHTLARGKLIEDFSNPRIHLTAHELALRIYIGALLGNELQPVDFPAPGLYGYRFFFADFALPDLIEAQVRYDPVEPGAEGAIETKFGKVPVDPQKSFLVHVARVFFRMQQVEGHAQDIVIVRPDQLLEGFRIATLRRANQVHFDRTLTGALHR